MRYLLKKMNNTVHVTFEEIRIRKNINNYLVSVESNVCQLSDYVMGVAYRKEIGKTLKEVIKKLLKQYEHNTDWDSYELFYPYEKIITIFDKVYKEN